MRSSISLHRFGAIVAAIFVAMSACGGSSAPKPRVAPAYPLDAVLQVNDIQVIGTHNSYHLRPPRTLAPGDVADYEHPALDEQLNRQGVRTFELDVFNGPGFPVAHTPVIDATSNCPDLATCLGVLRSWSSAHPGHVPIFVLIEPKTQTLVLDKTFVAWDAAAIPRIDDTVRRALPPGQLLTPDQVRGKSSTLRAAVVGRGWPTLGTTRGRIAVVLNTAGPVRDLYLAGRPALEGAPLFVTADERAPSAAVLKRDEPAAGEVRRLAAQGFIVRSLTDDRNVEARANDHTRANIAIDNGVQLVSSDYPVADAAIGPYEIGRAHV